MPANSSLVSPAPAASRASTDAYPYQARTRHELQLAVLENSEPHRDSKRENTANTRCAFDRLPVPMRQNHGSSQSMEELKTRTVGVAGESCSAQHDTGV